MTTFTEIIPPTKTSPSGNGIEWQPATGTLEINLGRRNSVKYTVVPFACHFPGRAFRLTKLADGCEYTRFKIAG
jgi:hypothetical protein